MKNKYELVTNGELWGVRATYGTWPFRWCKFIDLASPGFSWRADSRHYLDCWGTEDRARKALARLVGFDYWVVTEREEESND